ncbi:MAG: ABC transporter permease [Verrucomicrobiota bacterium]
MSELLYLAWCYLRYHWVKTLALILATTVIVFLPLGLREIIQKSAETLQSRAETSPLLLGAKGSPLELVMNSLYFQSHVQETLPYRYVEDARKTELGWPIPLHVKFKSGAHAIVGTSLDYFSFREMQLRSGRLMAMLGECVLGSEAAKKLKVLPDSENDSVISTPDNVFDLAASYPLKMKVVGILQETGSMDDEAVFVDIKTAWVIEGLAHGHEDLQSKAEEEAILRHDGNKIIANASVKEYREITPANLATFHFHGDVKDFPMTGMLVVPDNKKAKALLLGRYENNDGHLQILEPLSVIDDLLETVFAIERYVMSGMALVAFSALCIAGLVFVLSIQLRKKEIATLHKLGVAQGKIITMLGLEIIMTLASGVLLAWLIAACFGLWGTNFIFEMISAL